MNFPFPYLSENDSRGVDNHSFHQRTEKLLNDEIEVVTYKKWFTKLSAENARLKRMYANLAMELDTAKYIIEKKL